MSSKRVRCHVLHSMPAMIPLTDSIQRYMNREERTATFFAYPNFRIFLAVRLQNAFVIVYFHVFKREIKRLPVAAGIFAVLLRNFPAFGGIGAWNAVFSWRVPDEETGRGRTCTKKRFYAGILGKFLFFWLMVRHQ